MTVNGDVRRCRERRWARVINGVGIFFLAYLLLLGRARWCVATMNNYYEQLYYCQIYIVLSIIILLMLKADYIIRNLIRLSGL
jgi:hypothetical protein